MLAARQLLLKLDWQKSERHRKELLPCLAGQRELHGLLGLFAGEPRYLLGAIAGVIVVLGVELLEFLRIDDPIGAVPVHGICGIWGTISLGLFACGKYGATGPFAADNSAPLNGLLYGGGMTVRCD